MADQDLSNLVNKLLIGGGDFMQDGLQSVRDILNRNTNNGGEKLDAWLDNAKESLGDTESINSLLDSIKESLGDTVSNENLNRILESLNIDLKNPEDAEVKLTSVLNGIGKPADGSSLSEGLTASIACVNQVIHQVN